MYSGHQVVGKLHTAWLRFGGGPGCFRHFFGMCEFAAAVGPVLEIDMYTINQEKVRAKCGVRDGGGSHLMLRLPPRICRCLELSLS